MGGELSIIVFFLIPILTWYVFALALTSVSLLYLSCARFLLYLRHYLRVIRVEEISIIQHMRPKTPHKLRDQRRNRISMPLPLPTSTTKVAKSPHKLRVQNLHDLKLVLKKKRRVPVTSLVEFIPLSPAMSSIPTPPPPIPESPPPPTPQPSTPPTPNENDQYASSLARLYYYLSDWTIASGNAISHLGDTSSSRPMSGSSSAGSGASTPLAVAVEVDDLPLPPPPPQLLPPTPPQTPTFPTPLPPSNPPSKPSLPRVILRTIKAQTVSCMLFVLRAEPLVLKTYVLEKEDVMFVVSEEEYEGDVSNDPGANDQSIGIEMTINNSANEFVTVDLSSNESDVKKGNTSKRKYDNPFVSIPIPSSSRSSSSSQATKPHSKVQEMLDSQPTCTICLSPFALHERICLSSSSQSCPHIYHSDCFLSWIKSSVSAAGRRDCPLCKREFVGKYDCSKGFDSLKFWKTKEAASTSSDDNDSDDDDDGEDGDDGDLAEFDDYNMFNGNNYDDSGFDDGGVGDWNPAASSGSSISSFSSSIPQANINDSSASSSSASSFTNEYDTPFSELSLSSQAAAAVAASHWAELVRKKRVAAEAAAAAAELESDERSGVFNFVDVVEVEGRNGDGSASSVSSVSAGDEGVVGEQES